MMDRWRIWWGIPLGGAMFALAGTQAGAFMAYVSNDKSNTVSVIDTNKWEMVRTIKVGQRPRGIEFTRDQKNVLVAVGDDDLCAFFGEQETRRFADAGAAAGDEGYFVL